MTQYGTPTNQPVWPPAPKKRRTWPKIVAVAIAAFAAVAGAIILIRGTGAAPAGTPLVGKDSGVAACEAIAKKNKLNGDNRDDQITEAEYKALRKQFADSGDRAIRDNGTKIVDIAWQIQGMGDDDALGALPLLGELMSAYTGLAGGCAAHGITIPPLSADSN